MSNDPTTLDDVDYDEQLERKARRLTDALRGYRQLAGVEPEPIVAAPRRQGYRNRARMVVDPTADQPEAVLGFYAPGSRDIVAVDHSSVHHPQLEAVLGPVRELLADDAALRQAVRFVDVRCTAGFGADGEQAIVTLAVESDAPADDVAASLRPQLDRVHQSLAASVDFEVGLHINVASGESAAVLGGTQHVVAGPELLRYALSGRSFVVPPTAFFQVNPWQLAGAHAAMQAALGELEARPDLLVDLYCGVGVHGLVLADDATRLLGTDEVAVAIAAARTNAEAAGVEADWLAAPDDAATDWLTEAVGDAGFVAVCNPARGGMSPALSRWLAEHPPQMLLYLSCEPVTLARDLDRLSSGGLELARLAPFDFMPQTDQVETLAVVRRRRAAARPASPAVERAFVPREDRRLSLGVSGPAGLPDPAQTPVDEAVWVGVVVGRPPSHGFLPKTASGSDEPRVKVERLRNVGPHAVVRLTGPVISDVSLRQRLRTWGHPVLGDEDFGDRQHNHVAGRRDHLDRLALHLVRAEAGDQRFEAEVPGQLMGLMRLPRKVLE